MLAFTIAHLSVIVLRFREPDRPRAFRVPLSVKVGGGSIPLPAALGALMAAAGWVSVIVLHEGARDRRRRLDGFGVALYVIYRRSQDKPLTQALHDPRRRRCGRRRGVEYGSILVPVFGERARRRHRRHRRPAGGRGGRGGRGRRRDRGALRVRDPDVAADRRARARRADRARRKQALARAKEVGEEYEGVEVATAMVRGRSAGAAIVAEAQAARGGGDRARRRGADADRAAARCSGGRAPGRATASSGETTRYVIEKAPCRVILTAPPAGEDGGRERRVAPNRA